MVKSTRLPALGMLAASILVIAACSTGSAMPTANTKGPFTIGYSNGGGVGNGFREEQVCTAKAEATALGPSKVVSHHRHPSQHGRGRAAVRPADADLQNVNAIVFNPNDPDALNPALAEAQPPGIVTVSVDPYVTDPNTWNLYNNQIKYAELGAKWLFEQLGGKGTVWYTRGLAGHPADSDRDIGFKTSSRTTRTSRSSNAGGTFTGWDPATATRSPTTSSPAAQYDKIEGIWASGMGTRISTRSRAPTRSSCRSRTPTSAASSSSCSTRPTIPGLVGAAVTNTASVGGAGVNMAYKLLTGEKLEQTAGAGRPNTVLLDPQVLDNTTDKGKADLKAWVSVPGLDPAWPLSLAIPGWTDYDPNGGPGLLQGRLVTSCHRAVEPAWPLHRPSPRRTEGPMTVAATDLLLEATDISKTYGAVVALQRASLAVRPGEVHALMGANGAGKSTLVKILTGAVMPDSGRIVVRGQERTRIRRPTPDATASCPSTRSRRSSRTWTFATTCA